jgi:HD-GYP domain-containing protein (c-di-GMP phosphodiesterase class II)
MPCLKVIAGTNKGAAYEVEDERVTLGRDETETVQIFDKGASRQHAEVFRLGEMYFIKDLGSMNGTFLNDEKIGEDLLRSGDRIRIGKTVLLFEDSEAPSVTHKPPKINYSKDSDKLSRTIEFKMNDLVMDEAQDLDEGSSFSRQGSPHLRVLYMLAKAFSTEKDISRLMKTILSITVDAVRADTGIAFIRKDGGRELIPIASYESDDAFFPGKTPTVSRTIIKRALKTNRSIMTQDATIDSRFRLEESVITKQIHSVICVPLAAMKETIGVIYIAKSMVGDAFSSEDLELVSTVGIYAALALESIKAAELQKETFVSAIKMLFSAIELKDPMGIVSSERIAAYSVAIAEVLALGDAETYSLKIAALLHNVGSLALSERDYEIAKGAKKREERIEYLKARIAEKLFKGMRGLEHLLPAVKHHHELCDGSGYPDGLKEDEIPTGARIISVASAFDRLLWDGGKRREMSVKDALISLNREAQEGKYDLHFARALTIAHRRGIQPFAEEM